MTTGLSIILLFHTFFLLNLILRLNVWGKFLDQPDSSHFRKFVLFFQDALENSLKFNYLTSICFAIDSSLPAFPKSEVLVHANTLCHILKYFIRSVEFSTSKLSLCCIAFVLQMNHCLFDCFLFFLSLFCIYYGHLESLIEIIALSVLPLLCPDLLVCTGIFF